MQRKYFIALLLADVAVQSYTFYNLYRECTHNTLLGITAVSAIRIIAQRFNMYLPVLITTSATLGTFAYRHYDLKKITMLTVSVLVPLYIYRRRQQRAVTQRYTQTEDICAICYDALESSRVSELLCHHTYHAACIKKWYEKKTLENSEATCPVCRSTIHRQTHSEFVWI